MLNLSRISGKPAILHSTWWLEIIQKSYCEIQLPFIFSNTSPESTETKKTYPYTCKIWLVETKLIAHCLDCCYPWKHYLSLAQPMERALMVRGTGKLFTVATLGGSGGFCQDCKSNPALLSAAPIRPAAAGLTAAQGVWWPSLPPLSVISFMPLNNQKLSWTVTIIYEDSSYLLQIQLSVTLICQ